MCNSSPGLKKPENYYTIKLNYFPNALPLSIIYINYRINLTQPSQATT